MNAYTVEDATQMIKALRSAIELSLISPRFNINSIKHELTRFDQDYCVVVRLRHYITDELRGAAGSPLSYSAHGTTGEQVIANALAAALTDPKHVSITHREMERTVAELCIIAKPERIKNTVKRIALKPGKQGVMLKYGIYGSTIMPDEAKANKWSTTTMLEELCVAAGIGRHHWSQPNIKLYKFEIQKFKELSPDGEVVEEQ